MRVLSILFALIGCESHVALAMRFLIKVGGVSSENCIKEFRSHPIAIWDRSFRVHLGGCGNVLLGTWEERFQAQSSGFCPGTAPFASRLSKMLQRAQGCWPHVP